MTDDLTIPSPGALELDDLHYRALKAWYRTGSIKQVMQATGLEFEDEARRLVAYAADALDALRVQDVRGQRIVSTQRLADMIHRLEDYWSAVPPEQMTRSHQAAMKLTAELQRTLNEIIGVQAPQSTGPSVVILNGGFQGTADDARALARDGRATVIDTRKPWDAEGEVVDDGPVDE